VTDASAYKTEMIWIVRSADNSDHFIDNQVAALRAATRLFACYNSSKTLKRTWFTDSSPME
jgi:hypothetical protein